MSVEKHNNNFFLYALGSAFMLVSGAMLIASPSFEVAVGLIQPQTASVIESLDTIESVVVPSSISGTVVQLQEQIAEPLAEVSVVLFESAESGLFMATQSTQTNMDGEYEFVVDTATTYQIVVPWNDTFEIVLPEPHVDGFDVRQTSQEVAVLQGGRVQHIDFVAIPIVK